MPSRSFLNLLRRLRTSRRRLAIGAAALAVLAIATLAALLRPPAWYQPPVVPTAQRQQVRNNLIDAEQAFTENLRAQNGIFVYHIYQNDLNRWLTMRREIHPVLEQLTPSLLADPFVRFDAGRVTIAGRLRDGLGAVVSVEIEPRCDEQSLILQASAVRLGRLRLPMRWIPGLKTDSPIQKDADAAWPGSPPISGSLTNGLKLGRDAWWKNGGLAYRVLDVRVRSGQLDLTIEPLGHQDPQKRKAQTPSASSDSTSRNRP